MKEIFNLINYNSIDKINLCLSRRITKGKARIIEDLSKKYLIEINYKLEILERKKNIFENKTLHLNHSVF